MENIIYFDLEVKRNSSRIQNIGTFLNDEEFHGTSGENSLISLKNPVYFCGHNIIGHDIPVLLSSLKQADL